VANLLFFVVIQVLPYIQFVVYIVDSHYAQTVSAYLPISPILQTHGLKEILYAARNMLQLSQLQ